MTSSQALTQSVFGAVREFGFLDLLKGIPSETETGQPAFFDDADHWTMKFEHDVDVLNEPRPSNVDALLSRNGQRVAIECKFLETEFGTCSRIGNSNPTIHCDGNYRRQHNRTHRCALAESGILYWQHLPGLFNWSADVDHVPCPFGATYHSHVTRLPLR